MSHCDNCSHNCKAVSPEWKRQGEGRLLMVIGQNPGKMEANLGRLFVGPFGELVKQVVKTWDGPIYASNAVMCRPQDHKVGLPEVEACLPRLIQEVAEVKPSVILALGELSKSAIVRMRDLGVLEGITIVHHPIINLGMKGSGLRQGAWVQSCQASIIKALTAVPPIEVFPFDLSTPLPNMLGSDTEYWGDPMWHGPKIWGLSDGRVAWTVQNPGQDMRGLFLGREVVFHHSVNELVVLRGLGVSLPETLHDTMVLAALEDEEGPRDLKVLAATKLGYVYDEPKVKEMAKDEQRTTVYCAHDARAAVLLYQHTYREFAKTSWLYQNLYQPVIPVLADMSYRGIRIDKKKAQVRDDEIEVRLRGIDGELKTFKDIGWGSDEQVADYFVEKGYPLEKQTAGGERPSVDKESLTPLSRKGVREAALVLERRALTKTRSTYLKKIINAPDDHLRTILNPVGAETGRISSGGQKQIGMTNLQNIPFDEGIWDLDTDHRGLRDLFLPPEGMVWVGVDASQHEVRVLAWLAESGLSVRPLSTAVAGSSDFYRYIGEAYLKRTPTSTERDAFKTVVLAGQYLARPGTIQRNLEQAGIFVDRDQIEKMMAFVDGQFPTIRWWHERLFQEARDTGQITTPLGRRRHIFVGQGGSLTPETRRIIVNSPVQGTASDLVLFGCLRASKAGLHMLLTVHDSIDAAAYPNEVKDVAETLRAAIVKEPLLGDFGILSVKVKAGPSWGELRLV